ncbi:MAG: hypothetical protein JJT96_04790 [Opitutales bacterium]|nr:hypothetical protein [Opitutales bacterium]
MKPTDREKDDAWIGDAILALFARRYILAHAPTADRVKMFTHMTCNQFLSGIGEPTRVEAAIGRVYIEEGLEAAFAHIEANLLPLFQKQWTRAANLRRTKG